jgi:hypothetical protein
VELLLIDPSDMISYILLTIYLEIGDFDSRWMPAGNLATGVGVIL